MIIGGAYQGKLAYAKETFPDVRWTDGEQCEKEAIFQYRGIFHFHKYIERLLSEGEDISELAKQLKEKNPDLILVTDVIDFVYDNKLISVISILTLVISLFAILIYNYAIVRYAIAMCVFVATALYGVYYLKGNENLKKNKV